MDILTKSEIFSITKTFWKKNRINFALFILLTLFLSVVMVYSYTWHKKQNLKKQRYVAPQDLTKLPAVLGSFWAGKIAETKSNAYVEPSMFTTHVLVSGSTGSGKSVTASIFAEEALRKNIPVIVFDPTAQWTGFVKACNDENLLKFYSKFGMKREEAKSYKGLIYDVDTPDIDIDFKKFMNPGEVTVFNLSHLKPGEYDQAVMHIVQKIFDTTWEESPELKLMLVFDEVHRLLEKYGGKGGYIALEKACREFRKWGIGIMMASQVSADFKEAVQGNILTEIQLNTKSMEDIKKIEDKYGAEFAARITKQSVGVGMIQNPRYNDGKPWFVQFRPPFHNPHKISEEDLALYKKYTTEIENIERVIDALKKKGSDVTDLLLELKLAKDKLKTGRFRMAEIYIDTLKKNIHYDMNII